ncbi:MAG TPA: hypothetical protein VF173_26925 [Thermoanaerobaculia bacterium]|nr:hypothetical protein [Thermoanaerobaculia bacterium]
MGDVIGLPEELREPVQDWQELIEPERLGRASPAALRLKDQEALSGTLLDEMKGGLRQAG